MTTAIERKSAVAGREQSPVVSDELARVVSTLRAMFPHRDLDEVAALVSAVHRQLSAGAAVVAHLIPLTINPRRRLLIDQVGSA